MTRAGSEFGEIAGKSALVTGASQRIGRALAVSLAKVGARVVIHYGRSRDTAEELAQSLRHDGFEAVAIGADFSKEPDQAAHNLLAESREHFGDIQILVNNAAIFEPADLRDTTTDLFDRHLDINLKAPLFLCQAFAQAVDETGLNGHIVQIADWRGTCPDPAYLAYSLTKCGLIALTRALARSLGASIQVNAIAPGAILPPPGADESHLRKIQHRNCLNRHGDPSDIVQAMMYLLKSKFVTGEVIHVNGGEHL